MAHRDSYVHLRRRVVLTSPIWLCMFFSPSDAILDYHIQLSAESGLGIDR